MGSKFVPESFSPAAQKVRKVTVGIASDSPDISLTSTGAVTLFDVSNGVVVRDIVVYKVNAFNSTGAFTMTIGTDTDADGFLVSTGIVASDAGLKTVATSAAAATAYHQGYVFDSDKDTSTHVQVTIGTAKINAGLAEIYLVYFDKKEL